ncbi:MAG: hypothetical protein ACTSQS_09650 [Promethearchaeota archaeon]
MLYCSNCDEEVIIFGISYGAIAEDDLNNLSKKFENEGKLILLIRLHLVLIIIQNVL